MDDLTLRGGEALFFVCLCCSLAAGILKKKEHQFHFPSVNLFRLVVFLMPKPPFFLSIHIIDPFVK